MTTSRGTIGLAALGYMLVFTLSAFRGWTSQRPVFSPFLLSLRASSSPLAISAIDKRGAGEIEGSDMSRVELEKAASMMFADHPMGVGANNFVFSAFSEGYYVRAGVGWADYSATVHNVYWVVLAETGVFGLITYLIFLASPVVAAFRCSVRHRHDIRGDLLAGLLVSIILIYLHSIEEWILITYRLQYMYAVDVGLIAGLATQMGYWRRLDANQVTDRVPAQTQARPRRLRTRAAWQ